MRNPIDRHIGNAQSRSLTRGSNASGSHNRNTDAAALETSFSNTRVALLHDPEQDDDIRTQSTRADNVASRHMIFRSPSVLVGSLRTLGNDSVKRFYRRLAAHDRTWGSIGSLIAEHKKSAEK
ncbi:MAG: hypothetical protein D6690_16200 [Nitrospirae bacterium]|nr:MAG: hypothetical protein D6690_16200 [Nitrospirota bacterium]